MTPSNRIFAGRKNTETHKRQLPDLKSSSWQRPYLDAMLEMNPDRLKDRITCAEAAIQLRLEELAGSPDSRAERQSLADAQNGLLVLKRETSVPLSNHGAMSQFPSPCPE
jgi:hypothetical protein